MANLYHDTYLPKLIIIHDILVVNAFQQAQEQLNDLSCDLTAFLEIYYQEGRIRRIWDDSEVQSLSQRERLRLFPQLNGLFKLAVNNLIYPL